MPQIWRWLMPVAVTMIAAWLAAFRLGYEPLWHDEAVTWQRASQSIPEMIEDLNRNVHGPFYYSIMHVWLKFGGDSEFWMRFFSALCFTLTVPVVYVIGRTVAGRRAGLYAACLTATAPFLIRHAQDARMYAMLTLFCSLALMSVARLISRQADRPPAVIGSGLRGWRRRGASVLHHHRGDDVLWCVYIVAVLGGMFSHNTAVALPVVTSLIFLAAIAAAPRFRWRRLRNLIAANTVALGLYVLCGAPLLLAVKNIGIIGHALPVSLWSIRRIFHTVYGNEYLPAQAVALAVLFAAALWVWRRREDWRWAGFILIGALGLPLMLLAVSLVFQSVLLSRVIIWASIPFYVGCAVGLARLPSVGLRRIVLVGLMLCSLYGVVAEYDHIREPWDQAVQALAQAVSSDDAVVICPNHIFLPFNHYWRRHERGLVIFGGATIRIDEPGKPFLVRPFLEPAAGEVSKWEKQGDEPRSLDSLLHDYSELWIIVRNYRACDSAALRAALSDRVRLVKEGDFGNGHLELFALRAG